MIIILEILALEPLRTSENANGPPLPGMPEDGNHVAGGRERPAKKRSRHNLPVLLDVLADRLCIWQSTALDEIKMMDDSQAGQPAMKRRERSAADPLKEFCVDIIMPL